MKKDKKDFAIIEFSAWPGFLIQKLVTESQRFIASSIDVKTLAEMEEEFHALLFQINLSDISVFPFSNNVSFSQICSSKLLILNKDLVDITKRNVYKLLEKIGLPSLEVERFGSAEEELFVKSNLNWGGELEKGFDPEFQKAIGFSASEKTISSSSDYYVIKRKDLSPHLWDKKDIVIEKYISNSEDKFCRLYGCGESFVLVHAYSPHHIKKLQGYEQDYNIFFTKEDLENKSIDIPEDLLNLIKKFHFNLEVDFYCLDIVYDDNLFFYVIDINTTPNISQMILPAELSNFLKLGLKRKILSKVLV